MPYLFREFAWCWNLQELHCNGEVSMHLPFYNVEQQRECTSVRKSGERKFLKCYACITLLFPVLRAARSQ